VADVWQFLCPDSCTTLLTSGARPARPSTVGRDRIVGIDLCAAAHDLWGAGIWPDKCHRRLALAVDREESACVFEQDDPLGGGPEECAVLGLVERSSRIMRLLAALCRC
jgi:hypothetical protein